MARTTRGVGPPKLGWLVTLKPSTRVSIVKRSRSLGLVECEVVRGEEPRFEIVYHLYSMPHAAHLRLKLNVPEEAGNFVGIKSTSGDDW